MSVGKYGGIMNQDSALILKKAYDRGDEISLKKVKKMLGESTLLNRLLKDPKQKLNTFVGLRAYEWRLLELCEIPFTNTLKKVQNWLELLVNRTGFPEGFSLTGEKDGLVACHNAMITTILMRMEYSDNKKIESGIDWILNYQSVKRGIECKWTGEDLFTRWGGCMKKTPCYYGVVKSMVALTEYKKRYEKISVDSKLNKGLEYILRHKVFKRLSKDEPIETSIIKNFYPYTYKSNLIEILSLLKMNDLLGNNRCKEAIEILKRKRRSDGFWQADTSYMKSAWIDFDKPKKPGLWISYIVRGILEE